MSEEDNNYIQIEGEEEGEEDENQVSFKKNTKFNWYLEEGGAQFDLDKQIEECNGIEKMEERKDTRNVVRKNIINIYNLFRELNLIQVHMK